MAVVKNLLSNKVIKEIEHWLKKFPKDRRQSALIPSLMAAQEDNDGYLTTEIMDAVADYLQIPRVAAYEVATFYSMFDLEKVGRNKIYVCTNVACMLNGSDKIVDHLKKKLKVDFGQTTKDGKFFLKETECLASCGTAPVCQINKDYHENLTPKKLDEILKEFD